MNRSIRASIVLASLMAVVACAPGDNAPDTDDRSVTLIDALGDTVHLSASPHRIVSLAPSLTETVYALDEQDRLVGVTDFCDYPAEAKDKPRVAGFNLVNLEAVVGSQPDLVISNRGNAPQDIAALRRMDIPVFTFRVDSLTDLVSMVETLGSLLGTEDAADSVAASWRNRIARVNDALDSVPITSRPRVFFGGMNEPIYSVGPGSYIHNLIIQAGGRNVFGDLENAWPRVDLETLVTRDPDVVVIGFMSGYVDLQTLLAELSDSPGWRSLGAVREARVYSIGDEIMRPGPRLMDAFEKLHRYFYADVTTGVSE